VKLASTELESSSVLTLHIAAPWMNITETTTAASTNEAQPGEWLWPSHIRLLPYIAEGSFAVIRHLRVMIVKAPSAKELMEAKTKEERTKAQEKGTVVGYANIALGGTHLNDFQTVVTAGGDDIGELSGKIISRVGKNLKKDKDTPEVKSPSTMLKQGVSLNRKDKDTNATKTSSPASSSSSTAKSPSAASRSKSPAALRDLDDSDSSSSSSSSPALSPKASGASSLKSLLRASVSTNNSTT